MEKSQEERLAGIVAKIPLAHAMKIRVAEYTDGRLTLAAPAATSKNHMGIAFGGAIECLGTLAGWGLLWLALDDPALRIVIQRAETTFHAPLEGDLHATAELPDAAKWERFAAQLERRGRARIGIHARIGTGGQSEGALFHGHYAVASGNSG